MLKQSLTVEDLEQALRIPSFEEELTQSDFLSRVNKNAEQECFIAKCPECGEQYIVGPGQIAQCPREPHDKEDNPVDEVPSWRTVRLFDKLNQKEEEEDIEIFEN